MDHLDEKEGRRPVPAGFDEVRPGIGVAHGDCLDVMRGMPEAAVDLILCDPPYGTTACRWDSALPFEAMWRHYERVGKPRRAVVLTAMQPFSSALVMSNPKAFRYEWVWRKNKPRGHLNANRQPLRNHEVVLVFSSGQTPYYPQKTTGHAPVNAYTKHTSDGACYGATRRGVSGGGSTERFPLSVIDIPVVGNGPDRLHPTQKPVALMEYLVRTYTREGDVVLDNCMGSGTTAIACLNTGRRFLGIERDDVYFEVARERIRRHSEQAGFAFGEHAA